MRFLMNGYDMIIGLVVLALSCITMLTVFKRKHKLSFIILFLLATTVLTTLWRRFLRGGVFDWNALPTFFYLPVYIWMLTGSVRYKIFIYFTQYILLITQWYLVDAVVGAMELSDNINANFISFLILAVMFSGYIILIFKRGSVLVQRLLKSDNKREWTIYAFGAVFAFAFMTVSYDFPGSLLQYIMGLVFVVWSLFILCYAIVNTHEKATHEHNADTLAWQMNAMREQIDAEKKHREDMALMRHDMRHEMAVITELYRTGKPDEAEAVYTDWQNTLQNSIPEDICAEPILNAVFTRFVRRAEEKNIQLYIDSNIRGEIPIDTIKLSVMVSNTLENALNATDKIRQEDKRIIRVKLIQDEGRIGLEVVNPCASPVEFDGKGLPVAREKDHGVGTRSIAAFAHDNDYMLDFKYADGKFTVWLVMATDATDHSIVATWTR